MSVNWKDSTSPARRKAHDAAMVSGEFDPSVPTWMIYADLREALIYALLMTGFPPKSGWRITQGNWEQIYCRLHILERVRGCYRVYNNGDLPSRKMYFTPQEIRSMVGLSVNAGNKSDAEFRKAIMLSLTEDAKGKLDCFINPPKQYRDDPYYWEKLHAPRESA